MAVSKKKAKKKVAKKKVAKKKVAKKKVAKKKTASQRKNKQPATKRNPNGAGNSTKGHLIEWEKVDRLCRMQCTGEEIASLFNIDYDTLDKYCKKEYKKGFGEYRKFKAEGGKASLRRRQWLTAEGGNAVMQIWLGKQYLGQKDKNDFSSDDGSMSNDNLTAEQRKKLDKLNDDEY